MIGLGITEISILVVVALAFGFSVWMVVEIWRNNQLKRGAKILWTISILVFHIFAAAYYFFAYYNSSQKVT